MYSIPEWVQFFTTCLWHGWSVASIPNLPSFIQTKPQLTYTYQLHMQEETQQCHGMAGVQTEISLPSPILFASKMFFFAHAQPQNIALYFIDQVGDFRFTCRQPLKKINLNTVITALKESDPQTVFAYLRKESKSQYSLMIRVEEQYLQPIQEVLIFRGRKLNAEQKQQMKIRKMGRERLQRSEQQIIDSIGYCYKSGEIKSTGGSVSILLPLPYSTTLYSFDFSFRNMQDSIVFFQFYYIKGKNIREIQAMPKEGLFVMGQMQTCIVVKKKGFNEVMMKIRGKFDDIRYIVKLQKVTQASKLDKYKLKKWAIIGGLLAVIFVISLLLCQGNGANASTLQT